jgi:hypothetical protein
MIFSRAYIRFHSVLRCLLVLLSLANLHLNFNIFNFQELEVEKFITHSIPFSEINKAFDYMLKGEGLRCIIRMEG